MKKYSVMMCILLVMMLAACGSSGKGSEETERPATQENGTQTEPSGGEAAAADEPYSEETFAMDTYMTVTAYGEKAREAVQKGIQEITRIDELLSTGKESSEVAQINADGGGELSEDTAELLLRSLELWESTGGCFDIAIYPVMEEWGFTTGDYRVPGPARLAELLKLADPSRLSYEEKTKRLTFGQAGMAIDFGGIAKGYTSGRIMEVFRECGVTSGLVSLGGNVQVLGAKPDGSDWRVAIRDPEDDSAYLGVLNARDTAVITSGGYERYFEKDGVTYHHIIDPATGYPAENGLTSVTIVSADGMLADGLSTSLFVMGKDKAVEYWRRHSVAFDVILVTEDGKVYVSENIAEDFSSEREFEVIEVE